MTAIALPERQQTPEWRKRREGGIGSSDAPIIAGVAPWGDIRTLFAEKVGWAAPTIETRPMSWGKHLEPAIAAAYADETGRALRRVNRLLQHREHPWMLASLDRVVVGERRLVEIKTARFASEQWGSAGSDEVPDHYRLQVLHQLSVTGYEVADIVVLFAGSDLRIYTVPRDEALLADLVALESAFWSAVQAKSLPADLANLGPRPVPLREGEVAAEDIGEPLRLTALAHRVAELRQNSKGVELLKEQAEDELKAAIDEYTAIRGDGFRITYRQQADRQQTGWEQVAAGYRTRLEELGADFGELETLRDLFTTNRRGNRPLLITLDKEKIDDAPL
jgi:putative phage-type endonuclease